MWRERDSGVRSQTERIHLPVESLQGGERHSGSALCCQIAVWPVAGAPEQRRTDLGLIPARLMRADKFLSLGVLSFCWTGFGQIDPVVICPIVRGGGQESLTVIVWKCKRHSSYRAGGPFQYIGPRSACTAIETLRRPLIM